MDITRWGELVRINECSLLGIAEPDLPAYACKRIYDADDRAMIQFALDQAEANIERVLGYPISYKEICGEEHPWGRGGIIGPFRWGHIREFGDVESAIVSPDVALNLGTIPNLNDPVVLQFAWAHDACELIVLHDATLGSDQILPSSVTVLGGIVTIRIPRCRLVNPTLPQPAGGFDYNANANFVTTVDIVYQHVDPSHGAELVWFPPANCEPGCAETVQAACAVIRRRPISTAQVWPATYVGETPTAAAFAVCNRYPDLVRVSYIANYSESCPALCQESPFALEMAVVRYAHTLLPRPPCPCSTHELSWLDDVKRADPPLMAEGNVFGWLNGQVFAWNAVRLYAEGSGGLM